MTTMPSRRSSAGALAQPRKQMVRGLTFGAVKQMTTMPSRRSSAGALAQTQKQMVRGLTFGAVK
ncbi:hypothetical protein [Halomonas maura]|uniref:hypothetical protein n=1 Tax=Halomonas maura TaxID=117606 RepID=UPI0025B53080|nr:hypothetical protein [Halomonas maura]MDN3554604.1 hypothetical protein [Halomonas maura]